MFSPLIFLINTIPVTGLGLYNSYSLLIFFLLFDDKGGTKKREGS